MDTIARREVKYLVPVRQLRRLRADLAALLCPDANSKSGG